MLEFRATNGANRIEVLRNGLRASGWADQHRLWSEISGELHLDIGFLPPGLKWISPARTTWLFQFPPRRQAIFYHQARAAAVVEGVTAHQSYDIPLPWTFLVVEIGPTYVPARAWLLASSHPLGAKPLHAHHVGCLPLPNHYASGQICFAPTLPERCADVGAAVALAHDLTFASYSNADTAANLAHTRSFGDIPVSALRGVGHMLRAWEQTSVATVTEQWHFAPPLDSFSYPEVVFAGPRLIASAADLLAQITRAEHAGRSGRLEFALHNAYTRAVRHG